MKLALVALALTLVCGCSLPPVFSTHSVKVNWLRSATKGVRYNLYRAAGQCEPNQVFEKLTPSPIDALTYTDSTVRGERKYCYRVTSTDGKVESGPSQQVDVVVP